MWYELIVIWETGERESFGYETYERAAATEREMKKVFGCQISWTGINERR